MPALSASPVQQQEAESEGKEGRLVGQEDQSRFAYLRQMNALKLEMKKAVHQENFERAAELRDQISLWRPLTRSRRKTSKRDFPMERKVRHYE